MANTVTIQTIQDGQNKVIVKVDGFVDTSDLALTTILDPATLSAVDQNGTKATKLTIEHIAYDVEDLLSVNLAFDGGTPSSIWHMVGRGKLEFEKTMGGLVNNAGTPNGKITLVTQGWSASAILSFSFTMVCSKSWTPQV